jgi:tetratricopeptide (TPR) repeat protein
MYGQEGAGDGVALLQQEPFDHIFITEKGGGGDVKVRLIEQRTLPDPRPAGVLLVRPLLANQDFEVSWQVIERIDFWEVRLKREAEQRIKNKDYAGAYPFVALLLRDYPTTPGLKDMRQELVFQNAAESFRTGDPVRTLALLEEVRRVNPRFQKDVVDNGISRITDRMLQKLLDEGKLKDAQMMLKRMVDRGYSAEDIKSIPQWTAKFRQMAEEKKAQGVGALQAGRYREARQLAKQMLNIDPEIPNGPELLKQIDLAYPMVRVGVLQQASEFDPTQVDNWAARRAGRLVYRSLTEMFGAGAEGGEYKSPIGTIEVSDDQQTMRMLLQGNRLPKPFQATDGYVIADMMLDRADPNSVRYSPIWASLLKEINVPRAGEVVAQFRRPHVVPQALMQIRLDHDSLRVGDQKSISGSYLLGKDEEGGVVFRFAGPEEPAKTQPREIYEVTMHSGEAAINSLLEGDVDVLDQIFPADASRLRKTQRVVVQDFPLPTLHVLIPWSDHPLVKDRTTRRAILTGINREEILRGDLAGGDNVPGCQVISGPMPAGTSPNDPLGYAYDRNIKPVLYNARLGFLLVELRKRFWEEQAKKKEQTPEPIKPLRIAYPANEMARVACIAIEQQLKALKIEVQLKQLPVGQTRPERGFCDLLYTIVAMWEPAVDARRLVGPDGLAQSNDQMVGLGLRQLESAKNWREVRDGLFELHRICSNELPVLPLFQLQDSFAYRREVQGIGTGIVSLYQNITRWRLNR